MKNYKTAGAFRHALEDRLNNLSQEETIPLNRLRKQVAFDRLLARLFNSKNPKWLLKGGYAIEFRIHNIARATKDMDFTIPNMDNPTENKILEIFQDEVKKNIDDFFTFLIGTSISTVDQAVYGGWRFPVDARLANRTFTKFHIDVCVGDAVVSAPEWQRGLEILNFADIPPANAAMLPRDQQFAEKVHAYTLPRAKQLNSRTRDLVDLVLLIEHDLPEKKIVKKAIEATFKKRKTHNLPEKLKLPPESWEEPYKALAEDCGVSKKTIKEAFIFLEQYWNKLMKD
ncbi:MAG: nucleotidyl transferase AbiEii/AbiGii toxin family protein [Candidatus Aureabacteria bacterium]|nr:nucleotidyl transferase AbiEii/AbiGii toxin family protein [Candidatus Auribacterota bacterium]